jgi:exonuclease SbcD
MRPFRFLHTADVHLGTPLQGWTEDLPAEWRQRLQDASEKVWQRIVDVAIEERVDFITIAGDLYDRREARMAVHFEWLRGFERLHAAGIPVVVSHGNHDPLLAPPPLAWPDNVHVFPAAPPSVGKDYVAPSYCLHLAPDTLVQVSGFSYGAAAMTQSLAFAFHRQPQADFAIGLYHGAVDGSAGHADYCATTSTELTRRGFDFWGLGHIHHPAVLRAARPTIVYPGNPQGRHIREDGVRGCVIVDVSATGAVDLHFRPTSELVWVECVIDVDEDDLGRLRKHALARLRQLCDEYGERFLMVRLRLIGESRLARDLADGHDFAEALRAEVAARAWPLWLLDVESEVYPPLDVATLADSPELIGECVRVAQHYLADPAAARQLLAEQLADVYHRGNELAVEDLTDEAVADLIGAARRLLLTYAATEEGS